MKLEDSVTEISGVGPKYQFLLEQLGIKTVEDLLLHVPFRYEDRTNVKKISELVANESATVIGEIVKIDNIFTGFGKRLTKGVFKDDTGQLSIVWFNQHYLKNAMPIGTKVSLFGTLNPKSRKPEFISPQWEKVDVSERSTGIDPYLPIYPTIEELNASWIRKVIKSTLQKIEIEENLPKDLLRKYKLMSRDQAIRLIHNPKTLVEAGEARSRLSFEELFFLHLVGMSLRSKWDKKENGHKIHYSKGKVDSFINGLPFKLTKDQLKAIDEILSDLEKASPMNRLLQGDVGSGKTVVAVTAILACLDSGFTCLYLAPTQMLTNQHYENIKKLIPDKYKVEIVTSNKKSASKDKPAESNKHESKLIIGTHAILHRMEEFSNVGLIIIDEQHKFGVVQRSKIVDYYSDKLIPNLLTMTATPIPRSLALTFYGDLNLSIIEEMPIGRKRVETWLIKEDKRASAYDWIKQQIDENAYQVFIVCPFIQESDFEDFKNVRAAEVEFQKIKKIFTKYTVDLLHGRLKSDEKDTVVERFSAGKTQILVTTPVIEVGIDIPNANIIFIETADRFGLASLHQLRGRVGRGGKQAYCILMKSEDSEYSRRLKYMTEIYTGNKLAEIDLKLRGPGNLYGTEQHGYMSLKIADVFDTDLNKITKDEAYKVFRNLSVYPTMEQIIKAKTAIEKN